MKCMICGTTMDKTGASCYRCPDCGRTTDDMVYRPSNCAALLPQGFGEQKGWICPVCGRGVAPWVDYCPCQIDRGITFATGTGTSTYVNLDLKEYEKYATTDCEELKL